MTQRSVIPLSTATLPVKAEAARQRAVLALYDARAELMEAAKQLDICERYDAHAFVMGAVTFTDDAMAQVTDEVEDD